MVASGTLGPQVTFAAFVTLTNWGEWLVSRTPRLPATLSTSLALGFIGQDFCASVRPSASRLLVSQVCDASGHVFLFDITKMGGAAFHGPSWRPTLRTLLESPDVLKVIFDGRADADALWHLHGVYLRPVYCLQACIAFTLGRS